VTLPKTYFEQMYEASPDPWGFSDRWYEERKRAVTLSALPDRQYVSAYEPGCSIGLLTEALAGRCDALLASDVSEAAVARAEERLRGRPHVRLECRGLPEGWPAGTFDLVLVSEILYYFDDGDLHDVVSRAVASVAPGGTLLTVHWLHPVADYAQTGQAVQSAVAAAAGPTLVKTVSHVEADFDLAVYVRAGGAGSSVAERTGLC
jgi:predicted TPR repeat methyltransferase